MEVSVRLPAELQRRFGDTWLNPLHLARRSLRRALSANAAQAHGRLLDVGCGNQRYHALFARVDSYVGVDLPSNSAHYRTPQAFADGLWLPFPAAVFDTILCTEVLEHVPEPQAFMCEMTRVLRPSGTLILTTPQTWGLHEVPHDYYRYTEYGLRYLAAGAGLSVASVTPTCGVWTTAGQRVVSFLFFGLGGRWWLPLRALLALALVPCQMLAAVLDSLCGHRGDTLDNLLVARKP